MAVTVKLPTILRKHAGNEAKVSAEGATLAEVLKDLESRYPGITKNVIADEGGLHRFINVYLNDEDVRYLGSLETEVNDGDTVSILPAVAGGQGSTPSPPIVELRGPPRRPRR
jgi:sulfur-carrier protein